jgi:hypothetical protein
MASTQQQLSEARQAFQSLQVEVQTLRALLEQQQSTIQALQTRTVAQPKPRLPDPKEFDGKTYRFDTWLPSIRAKLRVDGHAIGDSIAQFYYVYLNLEPSVQSTVLPQLAVAEASQSWDSETILSHLTRIYDNPNKTQEAGKKLLALKQGTDSIAYYIGKFETKLYEAAAQNWPDTQKILVFRNGLSLAIQDRLDQQINLPSDYPGFLRVVQQLSSRYSAPASGQHSTPRTILQPPQRPSGDAMDLNTVAFNTIGISRPSGTRARSISPVQRQSLRQEGKCVRCGSLNHWVAVCPQEPYRPSSPEQQFLRRIDPAIRRQVYRPPPGSQLPPGPTVNQLYPSENSDGYTSEQERKWMEEWENSRYDPDEDSDNSDSVGSDLVRLQKGQL